MKKLAFCFLIYDRIFHEELWKIFFDRVDPAKYTIYVHYKRNRPLKYFEKYKLKYCIDTDYGSILLVFAQNLLLDTAMKDAENQHFIFISQACVPLKSFDHVYSKLDPNYSYFNLMRSQTCFPRCDPLLPYINREHIRKASQWCILNRKHAEIMLERESLQHYRKIFASDEVCYITNIYRRGLEKEIIATDNLSAGATTFTNWSDMDYSFGGVKEGLKTYDSIDENELEYLLKSESLFGRKFGPGSFESFATRKYIMGIISRPSLPPS